MSIKLSSSAAGVASGLSRGHIAVLATVGLLGIGGSGVLVYHLAGSPRSPAVADGLRR